MPPRSIDGPESLLLSLSQEAIMKVRFGQAFLVVAAMAGAFPAVQPVEAAPGLAQTSCSVWGTFDEDDGAASNLTAFACGAVADDSTAIGVQCPAGKPQVRYYPTSDDAEALRKNARVTMTFTVGDAAVQKTMRFDAANGVFWASFRPKDPLVSLLISGGPLDVSSNVLGTHRFRLVGSTAAIATVLAACKVHIDVPPPMPRPVPLR
jgi:hypothetical protein